jgi:hypothetical protein
MTPDKRAEYWQARARYAERKLLATARAIGLLRSMAEVWRNSGWPMSADILEETAESLETAINGVPDEPETN